MSSDQLKNKVKMADDATRNLDQEVRKIGFELVLRSLLAQNGAKHTVEAESESAASSTGPKRAPKPKGTSAPVSLAPIPLDLKGKGDIPGLKDFYKEKAPANHQETLTVFVYYITKYLDIKDVQLGHLVYCYNEVNAKKPLQLLQLIYDTKHRKGWVDIGSVANTATLTIGGDNLVGHDLPVKK